ncbi:MAG: glutamine amidotransferase, partial [Rhodanobacteraceae bacterium]
MLLGSWPKWVLFGAIIAAAVALAVLAWRRRSQVKPSLRGRRAIAIWLLQSALLSLLLLLLWEPALSVAALKPQQNIIAVVVDDSRSMAIDDAGGKTREQQAIDVLQSGLVRDLSKRFQVRLYRLGRGVARVPNIKQLKPTESATQIGRGLHELAAEAATLPIGSIVLLSDGSDNSGGVDLATLSAIRRRRLPVNTIGFGQDHLSNDIELDGFDLAPQALQDSRLRAEVTIRQNGFSGETARLVVTASGAVVATRQIKLKDAPEQIESVEFNAGKPGVKDIEATLEPLPGETNLKNNRFSTVLAVDGAQRRILYVEGEPRWEYKFLRRAVEDDPALHIVSMLRTTQNRIYRQGVSNPNELADGFPSKPEDLFAYQGLILGSIESSFFTPAQQQMIKDFVDRRGGGLLFLAGRWALADGGYNIAPFNELLPVRLPRRTNTFHRDFVAAELTPAGKASLICRIDDDPEKSADHWQVLPYLANYQEVGTPKPGATVLARVDAGGKRLPLLVTENYGRGRTAVFATAGSWRWQMQQPLADMSQETFWRQL